MAVLIDLKRDDKLGDVSFHIDYETILSNQKLTANIICFLENTKLQLIKKWDAQNGIFKVIKNDK